MCMYKYSLLSRYCVKSPCMHNPVCHIHQGLYTVSHWLGYCSAACTVAVTCEKDIGMGLCTFNVYVMLSLHLVCLLFGTSIPTSFYIFLKKFFMNLFLRISHGCYRRVERRAVLLKSPISVA